MRRDLPARWQPVARKGFRLSPQLAQVTNHSSWQVPGQSAAHDLLAFEPSPQCSLYAERYAVLQERHRIAKIPQSATAVSPLSTLSAPNLSVLSGLAGQ